MLVMAIKKNPQQAFCAKKVARNNQCLEDVQVCACECWAEKFHLHPQAPIPPMACRLAASRFSAQRLWVQMDYDQHRLYRCRDCRPCTICISGLERDLRGEMQCFRTRDGTTAAGRSESSTAIESRSTLAILEPAILSMRPDVVPRAQVVCC
jgi:hypothetical protein